MSNKIKQREIQINIDAQYHNTNFEDNTNIMNEAYKSFNLITYTPGELNKFKDNILSLLQERDKLYMSKLNEYKIKTEKVKSDFDSEYKIIKTKFSNIIDVQAKMNSRLDQLNNYETFVTKTNEKITSHEIRLTNIREDFSKATQKYDKIYLDNLELPGYIGHCAKYKNCKNFFLDVIKDLATLNKYREKNIIDLKMYKDKLETIISSMNSLLDNNNKSQLKYINEVKEKILKDCNSMFESACGDMKEIRVENSKYAVDLMAHTLELSKKWDKIEKIREDLMEKFNYSVNKYQMLTDDTIKSFEDFKVEYSIIRRKFMELAEFIKDVRFRKNIGENVKKKEVKVMVKKILRKRKSFDAKDVQLLSDIENIENIDYKQYYNVENKNDDNNNEINEKKNNSFKVIHDKKIEKRSSHKNKNLKNNNNASREMINKKNLNKTAEGSKIMKNPLSSTMNDINNNFDCSNQSINVSPKNIQNLKSNSINRINSSEILNNKNNVNINISNKKENKRNNNNNKKKEKKKDAKEIINNETKGNLCSKDNQLAYNINNENENKMKIEENSQFFEKENITNSQNVNELNNNNINNDSNNRKNKNNDTNYIKKKELNKNKNIGRNGDPSQINLSKVISLSYNVESKPNLNDDLSIISSSNNKDNNIGITSEKSISFISEKSVNKFIMNDNKIVNHDKIIKELASELEQSTSKKDQLASNKKEIEQKFKNICNSIEPIKLSGQNGNTKENDNSNKKIDVNQSEKQKQKIEGYNIDNKSSNIELSLNKKTEDNNNNKIFNDDNNNKDKNDFQEKSTSTKINNNKNNINKSFNESMNNLNPIKVNNEIYINESFNSNTFNKKMHVFDQKLLNLELYTKEKILDLISQINFIKHMCKLPMNDSFSKEKTNVDLNKMINLRNKTLTNLKYKTFNNSSTNNNTYQDSFYLIKNKENISYNNNNDCNQNMNNTNSNINNNNSNTQLIIKNTNIDKKRYSLKDLNQKGFVINQKLSKKNNSNTNTNTNTNNNGNSNNNIYSNILFSNINNMRTNNGVKNDIIEEASTKIMQNINNDINCKFLKEIEKKVENGNLLKNCLNNDDLNYKSFCGSSRNCFAYSNSTFKGTEIRLVDLNKLVNNQIPKNRLNPINDNDYFIVANGKK